jgi:hypothetical protein
VNVGQDEMSSSRVQRGIYSVEVRSLLSSSLPAFGMRRLRSASIFLASTAMGADASHR